MCLRDSWIGVHRSTVQSDAVIIVREKITIGQEVCRPSCFLFPAMLELLVVLKPVALALKLPCPNTFFPFS